MGYAWEKLHSAVLAMTRSTESLQVRLAYAYTDSLMNIRPDKHLPEDLRPLLAEIETALSTHQARGDEGNAMASALALSEWEVRNLIEKVVSLYDSVTERGE